MPAFLPGLALLLAAFGPTLAAWLRCALGDELQSHLPAIPLLCWWLAARVPAEPGTAPRAGSRNLPALLTALGLLLFLLPGALAASGFDISPLDRIAARMLALVALIAAWCGVSLGPVRLRALAFPLGLLVLAVPLPLATRAALETALQHGSAAVAATLFDLAGVPVVAQAEVRRRCDAGLHAHAIPSHLPQDCARIAKVQRGVADDALLAHFPPSGDRDGRLRSLISSAPSCP